MHAKSCCIHLLKTSNVFSFETPVSWSSMEVLRSYVIQKEKPKQEARPYIQNQNANQSSTQDENDFSSDPRQRVLEVPEAVNQRLLNRMLIFSLGPVFLGFLALPLLAYMQVLPENCYRLALFIRYKWEYWEKTLLHFHQPLVFLPSFQNDWTIATNQRQFCLGSSRC